MKSGSCRVALTDSLRRCKSRERHLQFVRRVRSQQRALEGLSGDSRHQAALHAAGCHMNKRLEKNKYEIANLKREVEIRFCRNK
jgi:hypothetical protein